MHSYIGQSRAHSTQSRLEGNSRFCLLVHGFDSERVDGDRLNFTPTGTDTQGLDKPGLFQGTHSRVPGPDMLRARFEGLVAGPPTRPSHRCVSRLRSARPTNWTVFCAARSHVTLAVAGELGDTDRLPIRYPGSHLTSAPRTEPIQLRDDGMYVCGERDLN